MAGSADARLLAQASRAELKDSREHWRARALRAETISSAALDYIDAMQTRDQNRDDTMNRCATFNADAARALQEWADRQRPRDR